MSDPAISELMKLLKSNNYNQFRKHLKKHSEVVLGRGKQKYFDMEHICKYNVLTDEEQTL